MHKFTAGRANNFIKSFAVITSSDYSRIGLFIHLGVSMHILLSPPQLLDLKSIFTSAPVIYSLLLLMSIALMGIWLYSLITFRPSDTMPETFRKELRALLEKEQL